jgi:DNA-binding beta-propeller fold protein YncE
MIAPSIHRDQEKLNLMKSIQWKRAVAVLAVCILWVFGRESFMQTAKAQQVAEGPKFKVDPLWPQPLPDRWVTGSVGGTCVDAKDHVFTVNRGDLSPKEKKNATQAPPIIEYDPAGQMVNAWGNYETFPARPHGCFVDYEGNVWIAGNEDAIVQKYTHDGGKLLLQIGTKGLFDTSDGTMAGAPMNSSHTLLNLPSSIAVDPTNGDVYITDGYGNRRVVVFDRDGKFLRQWGVQGTVAQTDEGVPGVFLKVVHCVVIANDGLLYVCDRLGGRIEVFDKMGNFKRNIVIPSKTARSTGVGAACWVDFSPDKGQKYMYVADCGDEEVRVMDHATGKTLSSFGRPGHQAGQFENLHSLSVDSKGDIIIGETLGGHRTQMFRPVTQ